MSRAEDVIEHAILTTQRGAIIYAGGDRKITQAVVEAIRNLSPDDLAELIDGEVQTSHPDAAQGIGELTCLQRVVGPWQETP